MSEGKSGGDHFEVHAAEWENYARKKVEELQRVGGNEEALQRLQEFLKIENTTSLINIQTDRFAEADQQRAGSLQDELARLCQEGNSIFREDMSVADKQHLEELDGRVLEIIDELQKMMKK